ncbi:unnamed protein product [Ceratitis capitata]|uniref:(Mediterranean fruit fly) hypothetical protein n=1 Tax=Ceratitis capitata TaxID=7213 RepID=A0A811U0F4_CERCA|nr:unnamed protein product [Ceratitis capitata]
MPSEANTPTNGNVAIWVGRCNAGTATPAQHCSAVDKYMHMCMCVLVFTSIAWIHHRTYTLMPAEVSDDETTTPRQSSVRLRVWVCKVASVFVADSVDETDSWNYAEGSKEQVHTTGDTRELDKKIHTKYKNNNNGIGCLNNDNYKILSTTNH